MRREGQSVMIGWSSLSRTSPLSLLIKGIFLALALPGLATLWMAVFADVGASLIVTLNGMRLLGYGRS